MRKKKCYFDRHLIFPNILRRHEIFYDKVTIVGKFFYQNYGAHIWHWRLPLTFVAEFWTFQNGPNPGGDDEICDICFRGVRTFMDSVNRVLISYSTIFGYKIILKIRLWKVATEISISKFLTPPPLGESPNTRRARGSICEIHLGAVLENDDQWESC